MPDERRLDIRHWVRERWPAGYNAIPDWLLDLIVEMIIAREDELSALLRHEDMGTCPLKKFG